MRRVVPVNSDLAFLILRLVLGAVMLAHGLPKVTGFRRHGGLLRQRRRSCPDARRCLRDGGRGRSAGSSFSSASRSTSSDCCSRWT